MKELVRKNILNIIPYQAGKPIEETKRQLGLKAVVKLASNENPLGPSPKALFAIKNSLKELNRYPDSSGFYLKRKLSKVYGKDASSFILGNGSDELIDVIIKTFVEEDENIITSESTFLEYEIIAKVIGRRMIKVALKYFKYDLEAIKNKIDKKTKLIFISNPNNPTGTYVTKFELMDFLKGISDNVIVVLDEAYDTFVDVNDFPDSLRLIGEKNVIVLKTFSKAYGLAGLRLGVGIADPQLVFFMERVRQPFNVNLLAQKGAIAALEDRKFLRRTRRAVLAGKHYLYDALGKMGIVYVPSVANFILINMERDCEAVFKEMLKYGVIVRDMKQYGLKSFIRVTVGTAKENEKFIKVLKKVFK